METIKGVHTMTFIAEAGGAKNNGMKDIERHTNFRVPRADSQSDCRVEVLVLFEWANLMVVKKYWVGHVRVSRRVITDCRGQFTME